MPRLDHRGSPSRGVQRREEEQTLIVKPRDRQWDVKIVKRGKKKQERDKGEEKQSQHMFLKVTYDTQR